MRKWKTEYFFILYTSKTLEKSILLLLQRNGIDLSKYSAQAYNGAPARNIKASGGVLVIKKGQSLAEYTECRNHVLNLVTSYAYKNQSIKIYGQFDFSL